MISDVLMLAASLMTEDLPVRKQPVRSHRQPRLRDGEVSRTWPNKEGVYFVNGYPVTEYTGPRRVGEYMNKNGVNVSC